MIDNAIWFVGHSFNRIGEKSSFMNLISHPSMVLTKLDSVKVQTIPLKDYIDKYEITKNN